MFAICYEISTPLLDEAIAYGCAVLGVVEVLPPQRLAVEALLHGRHVLACLPTGLGKSMIFQVLPSVCSYLAKSGLSAFSVDPIVVIASPLIALMRNQVSGFGSARI